MKEVEAGRFVGPYESPPFDNYIQSPIGPVHKEGGDGTRLIFYLSYPRDGISVNSSTPKEWCTVEYPKFDKAIQLCIKELASLLDKNSPVFLGKSDMRNAFRNLGLARHCFRYLVMKARYPVDNKWYYFVDKCLPFGASINCALFQEFSNAIAHIVKSKSGKDLVNYLDDYLFTALVKFLCNGQIKIFLQVCKEICFPVSLEKTEWVTCTITFLGLLIDTIHKLVCIPVEKLQKAKNAIQNMLNSKKTTVKEIQKLCGFLNFICKAIVPGRPFMRRIYSLTAGKYTALKQHHHVKLNQETKHDLKLWLQFLEHPSAVSRPFTDFDPTDIEKMLDPMFYTDASKNPKLGCGGYCGKHWFTMKWHKQLVTQKDPSIAYLELYAVTIGILLWAKNFKNTRILLHCDNQSVVFMLNNLTSGCKNCMMLIRLIVMELMVHNVKVHALYVNTKLNEIADSLSRRQWSRFIDLSKNMDLDRHSEEIPEELKDMVRVWKD